MIEDLIEKEAQTWASELKYYNLFIERSALTPGEREKLLLFKFTITGIIRELEELKGFIKVEKEKEKVKNRIIKIFSKEFNNNGEVDYGFYTYEEFIVKGEENLGPQIKGIKVYFNKDNIDKSRFKNGGFILVAKDKMHKPWIYEIKDGKKPYIWVDEVIDFMENEKREVEENGKQN